MTGDRLHVGLVHWWRELQRDEPNEHTPKHATEKGLIGHDELPLRAETGCDRNRPTEMHAAEAQRTFTAVRRAPADHHTGMIDGLTELSPLRVRYRKTLAFALMQNRLRMGVERRKIVKHLRQSDLSKMGFSLQQTLRDSG